ncbi:MAG: Na+/H+ antiporter NhaC family protein [Deltaproteobacteria bacterium]|nr:MAG: Na+/H+ antiporter NhaC family protein [Deltaproteobacteria bacterium]
MAEAQWTSLIPPLLAIGLSIWLREVVLSLFIGVFAGALLMAGGNPVSAFVHSVDHYVLGALADGDHAAVIIFSMMLGGMVGVISRAGGARGLAEAVTRFASNRRRGQLSTWALGLFVFFDDFANTLLVGPTMRPITDRLRISREKLAFIVDATAAPVASIAVISSWIGMELGYIAEQYRALGIEQDAYWVFLRTIPHRFYPLLMLWFGLLIALTRRDFGPMLKAERRAFLKGKLLADGARPAASIGEEYSGKEASGGISMALVPIATVLVVIVLGLWLDGIAKVRAKGLEATLRNVLSSADSYRALLWASLAGCVCAVGLARMKGILKLRDGMEAWLGGTKSMVLAMVILVLAWSLGQACRELKTADFIVSSIGDWLPPSLLPALVFLVAAGVSFATGTSWGTMGILFPLVVPLAHGLAPGDDNIMLGTISSILAGSVFGDHCSPISDTTIMSSMASSCDHIDHVKTQLPYALVVAIVGTLLGDLACGLGLWNAWVGLLLSAAVLAAVVWFAGRPVEPKAEQ